MRLWAKPSASVTCSISTWSLAIWDRVTKLIARTAAGATATTKAGEHVTVPQLGRVILGDGSWSVTGPDMVKGAKVRVKSVSGTELAVEPAP